MNPIQSSLGVHNLHSVEFNPIHKHLVLNRTRKLRATNSSNADF